MTAAAEDSPEAAVELRYRKLSPAWRGVLICVASAAILLALDRILNLGFFVGKVLLDTAYLYWLCAPRATRACPGTTRCFTFSWSPYSPISR